jgi:hypothetical protein
MSMKVRFIKKVHYMKKCKKNNKIQTNQNIKSVQGKQQETILKWNLIYDKS